MSAWFVSITGMAVLWVALAPLEAQAQSYRCVDKAGKKHYGQTIPRACLGVEVEQLSASGTVVNRIPPPPTKEELEAKEAAERKRIDDEAAARERARRDRALLATYASEQAIDEARARELAAHARKVKEIEGMIESRKRRQADLAKEMEFYQGRNKPPEKLLEDMRVNRENLAIEQARLAEVQKDADAINARFDDDKKAYAEMRTRK